MEVPRPKVGIGVFVVKDGKFVMLLRKGSHGAGDWSLPGGHLELSESWEFCARRETREETGLEIKNVKYLALTNDIFTEKKHYVTIFMLAEWASGEPTICEPEKCADMQWFDYERLPDNLFLASKNLRRDFPNLNVGH